MKPSKGGTKRSSWLTFRRRLILVRALLRAPLSRDDLVSVVQYECNYSPGTHGSTKPCKSKIHPKSRAKQPFFDGLRSKEKQLLAFRKRFIEKPYPVSSYV